MIESSDILSEILIAFSTYTSPFRYNFRCFDRDPNSVLTLQRLSLVGINHVPLDSEIQVTLGISQNRHLNALQKSSSLHISLCAYTHSLLIAFDLTLLSLYRILLC